MIKNLKNSLKQKDEEIEIINKELLDCAEISVVYYIIYILNQFF